jgi:hypothetical protein
MNLKSLPLMSNNCYSRQEPTRLRPLTELHSRGRLLALPKNIRHGWKELTVTNTLAYYKYGKYGHKKVMVQAPDTLVNSRKYQRGKYHHTVDLLFDWFGISYMTTDNFC